MENNIIFLDIDGVLNQRQKDCYIDKLCLKVLIEICEKINANIVLTSDWRMGYTPFGECSKEVKNLMDLLSPHGIRIVGRTPSRANRELEIKEYLRTHDVTNYLIIDDDERVFGEDRPDNLMLTNYKTGLIWNDVRIACNIFWGIFD